MILEKKKFRDLFNEKTRFNLSKVKMIEKVFETKNNFFPTAFISWAVNIAYGYLTL